MVGLVCGALVSLCGIALAAATFVWTYLCGCISAGGEKASA